MGYTLALKAVAVDCETHLIQPGEFAPKTVCVSFHGEKQNTLVLADEGAAIMGRLLRDGFTTVWANPGFDIAALSKHDPSLFPLFVDALRDNRIWCVQIAQKIIDIADGCRKGRKYNLGVLAERLCGVKLDKGGGWRLRYSELDGVPVAKWPHAAVKYAREDTQYTWQIFKGQLQRINAPTVGNRVRFDVAAYYMSREGVGVDPDKVRQLEIDTLTAIAEQTDRFVKAGFLKDRNKHTGQMYLFGAGTEQPDWGKDYPAIQRAVVATGVVNRNANFAVRTDGGALRETGDPELVAFADYAQLLAVRDKDLKFLKQGVDDGRIHTRFDTLLDTGRVASFGPNLLNLRRAPGVRECLVPRPGFKFIDCDYGSAELHTHAQVLIDLFGKSALADTLNAGRDPHIMMAANLAGGVDYDEMAARADLKFYRQLAKIPNFGLPGGMGAVGFDAYARGYGVNLAETGYTAEQIIELWHATWPEMRKYFAWIMKHLPNIALTRGSKRVRKSDEFCAQCNYLFQGLAAEGLGLACWRLWVECYVDTTSVMFGCKPLLPIHDELLVEAPADRADECLAQLGTIMTEEFNKIVPDVPVHVEGEVKDFFSK